MLVKQTPLIFLDYATRRKVARGSRLSLYRFGARAGRYVGASSLLWYGLNVTSESGVLDVALLLSNAKLGSGLLWPVNPNPGNLK
jgi:hypothetical protein